MHINWMETDRAYTQAVKEVLQLRDCERCWAETATNWEQYDAITEEMAETACTKSSPPISTFKVIVKGFPFRILSPENTLM
jgi:hypothetical protein